MTQRPPAPILTIMQRDYCRGLAERLPSANLVFYEIKRADKHAARSA
jgi:hypothetical protein